MFPIRDHNPSGQTPYVTFTLIAINVLVFLWYFTSLSEWDTQRLFLAWGLVPARLMSGEGLETVATSMFLHAGWMHLGGNMLFLWIFGDNLEEEMGHLGFLIFYLACGAAAGLAQALPDPGALTPMVGASGAIAGVMGGYLLLFPKARVDVLFIFIIFFRVFSIPAWIVLGIWFAVQLFNGAVATTDGVAYLAHVGGFVAGLVLTIPALIKRGGKAYWVQNQGKPPHPPVEYVLSRSNIPRVPKR